MGLVAWPNLDDRLVQWLPMVCYPRACVQRLDPKLDIVFKILLTRDDRLLCHMLQGLFGKPITGLTVLNPDLHGELASDKEIILDLHVKLADGSRVDVEMQVRAPPTLAARLVFYCARDYASQLKRGEGYDVLTPTVVVVWMVEPLFDTLEQLHSIFELRERRTHTPVQQPNRDPSASALEAVIVEDDRRSSRSGALGTFFCGA